MTKKISNVCLCELKMAPPASAAIRTLTYKMMAAVTIKINCKKNNLNQIKINLVPNFTYFSGKNNKDGVTIDYPLNNHDEHHRGSTTGGGRVHHRCDPDDHRRKNGEHQTYEQCDRDHMLFK